MAKKHSQATHAGIGQTLPKTFQYQRKRFRSPPFVDIFIEKLPARLATEAAPVSYVVAACAVRGVASLNVDAPIWFDKAVDPRFDGVFLPAVGVQAAFAAPEDCEDKSFRSSGMQPASSPSEKVRGGTTRVAQAISGASMVLCSSVARKFSITSRLLCASSRRTLTSGTGAMMVGCVAVAGALPAHCLTYIHRLQSAVSPRG